MGIHSILDEKWLVKEQSGLYPIHCGMIRIRNAGDWRNDPGGVMMAPQFKEKARE